MPDALSRLVLGDLTIDVGAREVTLRGASVDLTKTEFDVLLTLAQNPRRVVTYQELLARCWGPGWFGEESLLAVHVSRLRSKLGESGINPRYIRTVRGVGYRFEPKPPATKDTWMASGEGVHGHVATLHTNRAHAIQWASDSVRDLLGWHPSDLVGITVPDLIHPDDLEGGLSAMPGLEAGESQVVELRTSTVSGAYVRLAHAVRPIMTADGSVAGHLAELQHIGPPLPGGDVANAHLADGHSAATTPRLRMTVTLTCDKAFTLVDIDPRVPLCDWQPEEIIGRYFSLSDRDEATVRTLVGELVAAGVRETKGIVNLRCKSGSLIPVQTHTLMLLDEHGDFDGYRTSLELPQQQPCA